MASIRRRQNKWQVRIRRDKLYLTKTFHLKSQAQLWAKEIEIQIEKGKLKFTSTPTNRTLGDVLKKYLQEITPRKKSSDREESRINNLIKDPIALVQFSNLRPQHVITFRNHRLNKVTSGTVLRELAVLSHVIKIGIEEWGLSLDRNPVQQITKPKQNPPRDRRLEFGEEELLLKGCNATQNPYFKALVVVALETGMRRGELLRLEREHINFDQRTAHLPITKNGWPRTIPLSSRAIEEIKNIPAHISKRIFPISETAIRGQWRRMLKRTGIKNLRLHDLRHEATTRFFELGFNVIEVATITGHRDLAMLKRYTHIRASDLALKLP